MDPSGTLIAVIASIVGMEVIKTLVMRLVFPAPPIDPPIFTPEEKRQLLKLCGMIAAIPVDCTALAEEERQALLSMFNLLMVKDTDGVPLVYVPRSWIRTQEETLKISQTLAFSQKEVARALEDVTKVLDRLVDKVNAQK